MALIRASKKLQEGTQLGQVSFSRLRHRDRGREDSLRAQIPGAVSVFGCEVKLIFGEDKFVTQENPYNNLERAPMMRHMILMYPWGLGALQA